MAENNDIKARIDVDADDAIRDAAKFADAAKQVGQAVDQSGQQSETASRKVRNMSQRQAEAQRRLEEMIRVQLVEQDQLQKSGQANDAASKRIAERQERIKRLADALQRQADLQRRVQEESQKLNHVTEESVASNSRLDKMLGTVGRQLLGVAGGMAGAGGVIAAYKAWEDRITAANERLAENARLSREVAEAQLDFVALSGVSDPEQLNFLNEAAAFAGRRPGEVAQVGTLLQSRFPKATPEDINSLVAEVAATGQLTSAPLATIAGAFATLYKETGDARVSSNILQEAITQAGEPDPAKLGQLIGQYVGIGRQIGGLSAAEAAGFAAAGTGLNLPNDVAITGLKNVAYALRGKGTPEGREVLEREAISTDSMESGLRGIASAFRAGRITPSDLESLGGREAAPVFAALTDQTKLDDFFDSVNAVIAASKYEGRTVSDKAGKIFTDSTIQRLNLFSKQIESREEGQRASDELAIEIETAKTLLGSLLEQRVARGQMSETRKKFIMGEFALQLQAGGISTADDPTSLIVAAARGASDLTPSTIPNPLRGGDLGYFRMFGDDYGVGGQFADEFRRGPQINVTNITTQINSASDPLVATSGRRERGR